MSAQNNLLKNVSADALKEMLAELRSLSGEDKQRASSEYTKALMQIQETGADFTPQSVEHVKGYDLARDAFRRNDALDQPLLREKAEYEAGLDNKIRKQRAQGALEIIDPLLTRSEDRTARRDTQQYQMLGDLISSREKIAGMQNMTNKLGLVKDLGLGLMIMGA